jgi:rod shape-determining protein MreD
MSRILQIMASPWTRLVLVGMLVLSLQTTLFSNLRPFDTSIQVMGIFVGAIGVMHGMQAGAIAGLVCGLMYDSVLATPLGLGALVLGIVGVTAAGLLAPFRESTTWMRAGAAAIAAGVGEIAWPLMSAVVGLDGWLTSRLFVAAATSFVGGLVFVWPLLPVAAWTLSERGAVD